MTAGSRGRSIRAGEKPWKDDNEKRYTNDDGDRRTASVYMKRRAKQHRAVR